MKKIIAKCIGNVNDFTEDYPVHEYERTSKMGVTHKVSEHERGKERKISRAYDAIQKEYNFIAMMWFGKSDITVDDRIFQVQEQIKSLESMLSNASLDQSVLNEELGKKRKELIEFQVQKLEKEFESLPEKDKFALGSKGFEIVSKIHKLKLQLESNKKDLTEDYPVQEHIRGGGKVFVKAHERGSSKEFYNSLKNVINSYNTTLLHFDWDEIEDDKELRNEFTHFLSDIQEICRDECERKEGKADFTEDFVEIDTFNDITKDFNEKMNEDFTILHGKITRAGDFEYIKDGQKVILTKNWNNIKDVFKKTKYIPLKGSTEQNAHAAPIIGYASHWIPDDENEVMYGDVVTFKNLAEVTDLLNPKRGGFNVSIGFKDQVENGIQKILYLDHLAISLKNADLDRCSTANGIPCVVSVKKTINN